MSSLAEMLAQHEGKTLEFKRDVSAPENLLKTMVAFANGAGGVILIGVEDRTRRVLGIPDPTKTEELLANLVSDCIEPRLVPDVQIVPWRRSYVLAVHVFASSSRPHFLKRQGRERGVYLRVGSTNRRADPAQIDEIERAARGRTFDEEPLTGMSSEAIDFRAASECFTGRRKLTPADLRTMGILTHEQGRLVPSVGGLLLFGPDRLTTFPDAFLRAGCFVGADKSVIVDSADIKDYLPRVVDQAIAFARRNTRRALAIRGTRSVDSWEFPLLALREAITNALVHTDYGQGGSPIRLAVFEDRIEIDNPGGLVAGLTVEDIHRGVSKLRNRVIGRVFHALGLIEQWGSGIGRMTRVCLQAGLPEPVLEEIGSGFRVTFSLQELKQPTLDPLDQAILDFTRREGGAPTQAIAAAIHRTTRATRDRIRKLVALGLLLPVGSGPRDPRRIFKAAAK
jgi:ATP-dependent DNA helicase RecG